VSDLKSDLAALRIERAPERESNLGWVKWVVVLLVIGGAGYAAFKYFTRERPTEVQAATVSQRAAGAQAAVLNASGYVTARRRATVSSKITGKVVEVNVEEGMAVREGQVLARLDDVAFRASLALAQANLGATEKVAREDEIRLQNARLTLDRKQKLKQDGFATQAEVDDAKLQVDALGARLDLEEQQVEVARQQIAVEKTNLDNTVIRAPFSGIAISKDAQPGEMVSPVSAGGGFTRTGICTIVDMRSLEVEVDVNESYINRVRPDQSVSAVLDAYPNWQIPARVITVVPTADRQKATVLVRIGFEKAKDGTGAAARSELDARILPDMGVKVTFLRDADAPASQPAARPVTLAPKTAVKTDGATSIVFVLRGEIVERRAVQIGGTDGDRVEIRAGLAAGDRVVVSPPADLADGARVRVK
jgi:RND family efflux transporter MFP subunit